MFAFMCNCISDISDEDQNIMDELNYPSNQVESYKVMMDQVYDWRMIILLVEVESDDEAKTKTRAEAADHGFELVFHCFRF